MTSLNDAERWRRDAACRGMDPKIFYPEQGQSAQPAKNVCAHCPVQENCLEYSLTRQVEFGIWGGTSQRWRRTLQKRLQQEKMTYEEIRDRVRPLWRQDGHASLPSTRELEHGQEDADAASAGPG